MKKLKEILKILLTSSNRQSYDKTTNSLRIKMMVCIILAASCAILSIMNVVTKAWDMLITTLLLTVFFGTFAAIIRTSKGKATSIFEWVICAVIAGVFSYYAVCGKNEGFAILWIILVPTLTMLLLSFRCSLAVSVYFFIFLIVIFYSPVRDIIPASTAGEGGVSVYTHTMFVRFPILYFSGFACSLILSGQKTYYVYKSETNSLIDSMTNLRNRRSYNELLLELEKSQLDKDLVVVSIDMNGLKLINDTCGHEKGDVAISYAADVLREVFGSFTNDIFRTGGDEFYVFFLDKNHDIDLLLAKMENISKDISVCGERSLSFSYGYSKAKDHYGEDITALISYSEALMYRYKNAYYKNSNLDRRKY